MDNFPKIKATAMSLATRKLAYGVGRNDADYKTAVNGERCPYYRRWSSMLNRCYSASYQNMFPTYIGCTVCKDWLTFSHFRAWMVQPKLAM